MARTKNIYRKTVRGNEQTSPYRPPTAQRTVATHPERKFPILASRQEATLRLPNSPPADQPSIKRRIDFSLDESEAEVSFAPSQEDDESESALLSIHPDSSLDENAL
jgi:hypothetical protein